MCRVPAQHHKAKHRKRGLQLPNQHGTLVLEEVLMAGGDIFQMDVRNFRRSLDSLIAHVLGQILESPRLIPHFFTFYDGS